MNRVRGAPHQGPPGRRCGLALAGSARLANPQAVRRWIPGARARAASSSEPTAKSKHPHRKQLFPQQFRGAGIGHGGRGAPLVTKRPATPVGKTRFTMVTAFWSFLSSGPQRTAGGQSTGNPKTQIPSRIKLSVLGSHVKRDQGGPPPTMPHGGVPPTKPPTRSARPGAKGALRALRSRLGAVAELRHP